MLAGPGRASGSSKYSKSLAKPGASNSCLSAKTAQCLIGLPLVLALFALSLQVSCDKSANPYLRQHPRSLLVAASTNPSLQAKMIVVYCCLQWTTRDRSGQGRSLTMSEGLITRCLLASTAWLALRPQHGFGNLRLRLTNSPPAVTAPSTCSCPLTLQSPGRNSERLQMM